MSLQAAALLSPVPTIEDLYVVSVGTSATAAVDLFALFGIDTRQVGRGRMRITIRAAGETGFVFGDASVGAPALATAGTPGTAGLCRRIPAGGEAPMTLHNDRRFMRAIAASAATRVEIQVEGAS